MPFPNGASAPTEAMLANARAYNAKQVGRLWKVAPGVDAGGRQFALLVFAYQGLRNKDCPPPRPGSALAAECENVSARNKCCGNTDGMLGPVTLGQMLQDSAQPGANINQLQLASLAEWGLTGGVPSVLSLAYDDAGSRGSIPRAIGLSSAAAQPMQPAPPAQPQKSNAVFWFKAALVCLVVYQVAKG